MKESKNFITKLSLFVPIMFVLATSTVLAQTAPLSLFGNTLKTSNQSTCYQRAETNPYTNTTTYNEVCNPKFVDYNSGTGSVAPTTYYTTQAPYYTSLPTTYYTTPAPTYYYSQPTYNYGSSYGNSVQGYLNSLLNVPYNYYSNTNSWYPCSTGSGYCNEGLFNTYYRGGSGDYTGYYDYWGNRYGYDVDYTNGYDYYGGYVDITDNNSYPGAERVYSTVGGSVYLPGQPETILDQYSGQYYYNTAYNGY
jgi:hypothetical protein